MRPSSAYLLGFLLSIALFLLAGCSNPFRKSAKLPTEPAAVSQEGRPFSLPFLGDDVRGASVAVLENIKPLWRLSFGFLGAGGVLGLILGIRVGLGLALGGFTGLASCVLFSMYPRTVLLLPAVGLVFLVVWGIRRVWGKSDDPLS